MRLTSPSSRRISSFSDLLEGSRDYTLHSHTQFCDGRAPMEVMARAAADAGFSRYGFSPHSPRGGGDMSGRAGGGGGG
ncbi:MAG: hypothetical protein K2M04_03005, partial [Muribaculaceae bacterium]|nr:hypothetical protein [Muribaculaceae bacterium]